MLKDVLGAPSEWQVLAKESSGLDLDTHSSVLPDGWPQLPNFLFCGF